MKNMKKFLAIVMILALAAAVFVGCGSKPAEAPAQGENNGETVWPEKPVTIIVPYNAGGDSDFNARLLADKLSEATGQSFVVQNIAGNSGAAGVRQALNADPDGYTIAFNHTAFIVNYYAGASNLTYDDMAFGAVVGVFPVESDVLVCKPDLGFTKLSQIKEYSAEHPGEIIFGASTGTTVLVTGLRLKDAGLDITLVDTGGTAERMTAILGGHVDFVSVPKGNVEDYLKTGELIELENDLGTEVRCPAYYQMNFPKGTDPGIIAKFNELVENIVLHDEDYAKRISETYGQEPFYKNNVDGEAMMREMWEEFSEWNWK